MSEQPIIIKKKKSHGGHGHHGGSWKVAYADFVTAMMAFFMVMWIMGLSDSDKAQIQGYFNDPMGFNKTLPRSKQVITIQGVPATKPGTSKEPAADKYQRENKKLRKIEAEVKRALDKAKIEQLVRHVEVLMTREGLRIEFIESPHMAFFESGSSVLRPEAKKMVMNLAPILAKADREMMVEGHTDARPYPGKSYTNWDLSSERALTVRRALADGGVRYKQFKAVRGLADTELRVPSDPLAAANRRVSILLPWSDEKSDAEKQKIDISPEDPGIAPAYTPPPQEDDHSKVEAHH